MSNDYKVIGIDQALNLMVQLFGKPYVVSTEDKHEALNGFTLEKETDDEYDRLSQYGTPLFGTFKAVGGSYKVYDKDDKLDDYILDDFEFPVASIIEFSRKKNTVITETIGGKGTVKEIMGLSDWQISIRGLIVEDKSRITKTTVKEQQAMLDKLNEIVSCIEVDGKIFSERGIKYIVITELKHTPVQGKNGLVQYEINAVSDKTFFLDIK